MISPIEFFLLHPDNAERGRNFGQMFIKLNVGSHLITEKVLTYFMDGPYVLSKLQGHDSFVTFIGSPLKTINCRMKKIYTFLHLRGDSGDKFSREKNRHTKGQFISKTNGRI